MHEVNLSIYKSTKPVNWEDIPWDLKLRIENALRNNEKFGRYGIWMWIAHI